MIDLTLTPPLFAILSTLIEERIGLCYTLQDKELLESKLAPRALDLGFSSLLDYYYFLRYDPGGEGEFKALVSALVVNETYFFRELEPLAALVAECAALVERGRRPRIWCAACSTGEEPLTLAMLLEAAGLLGRVELIASDVSEAALAKARSGQYGRRSLRHTPPPLAARWLDVHERGISVAPALRGAVQWQQLNLVDEGAIEALGPVDFISCRNVLIYFRDALAARVVQRLARSLNPGGVLLVGVSESLLRYGTSLVCEETRGVFLYRKARS